MDVPNTDFTLAGTIEEVKAKGRIVLHGPHRPPPPADQMRPLSLSQYHRVD